MVQIIAGRKGKGKTKHLLDMANSGIKAATGSIVYLDKSSKHMYELNNRIRLINVNEYPVATSQGFIGFICGIISQDHDIETMFLDSFLKLAGLEGEDISETITTLEGISEKYNVNFVLSISMDAAEMPGERTERCSGFSVIHNSYSLQPGRQVLPGCLCDGNCVGFRRAHNSVRNRYQILPGGTGHWQKRKNQRL